MPTISQVTDTSWCPYFGVMQYGVAKKIEMKKGNMEKVQYYDKWFRDGLLEKAMANFVPTIKDYKYYEFESFEDI